ncbi:GNAT family N-acetyltransferase [Streptomyces fagopyri]|uniref:GNAT family N-acetyltransferase n=1 Tax=Streptomyces fagopyri TaxID=2662397 RepID=UPI0037F8F441
MGMSVTISAATEQDAEQILKLQYLCYQSEAELAGDYGIEPLTQPLDSLRAELADGTVLVARLGQEVVASVRGTADADGTARISKLIVHPRMQRHGIGARLLRAAEAVLVGERGAKRIQLHAGRRGGGNLRLYRSVGYETVGTSQGDDGVTVTVLEKPAETYATTA